MTVHTAYKFLEQRPESNYRQLFLHGRNLRAEVLYRATIGPEPRTPEEVAHDYAVPLEAVEEAIHYCLHHEALLAQEREEVLADMQRRGLDTVPGMRGEGTSGA